MVWRESKHTKLNVVFKILLLHMGLQLFREPQMAQTAIVDLEKCMERTQKKIKKKDDDDDVSIDDDEGRFCV